MKNKVIICVLLFLYSVKINAQQHPIIHDDVPVQEALHAIRLFSPVKQETSRAVAFNKVVKKYELLQADADKLQTIVNTSPRKIELALPFDDRQLLVELTQRPIMDASANYTLVTESKTETLNYTPGVYYSGIVKGDAKSFVSISFFHDNIMAVITHKNKSYVIGKDNRPDARSSEYLMYKTEDLLIGNSFQCGTESSAAPVTLNSNTVTRAMPGNCVRIYFVADYDLFLNFGSNVEQLLDYVSGLFNIVATIYRNESVNIVISRITVYGVPDPYITARNKDEALNLFVNGMRGGFNGNIAHLLSGRDLQGGKATVPNSLCVSSEERVSVTGFHPLPLNPFPTYTWTVGAVAHELGHNFGSPHTHECRWNGNNTPIDSCATDFCNPFIREGASTIMSYCPNPAQLFIGFGPQPGNLIRNTVIISAACLTTCCNSDVTITGVPYYHPLTESSTWIRTTGPMKVLPTSQTVLDADPVNGFVELLASNSNSYFIANPTSASGMFIAETLDGCSFLIPSYTDSIATDNSENNLSEKRITVYPNPSNGTFILELQSKTDQQTTLTVVDMLGQEIYKQSFGVVSKIHAPVSIGSYSNGLYFLKIQSGNEVITKQIIINR